jgi:hypothetical protein
MVAPIGWLAVFVVVCFLSLWWAASKLSDQKVFIQNGVEYPHNLEFNSSFALLFAIVLTIATSVLVGYLAARFIVPGDAGTPPGGTTVGVLLVWVAALALDTQLGMRAKVLHVIWPDDKNNEKVYRVTVVFSIAFSTMFTLSLAAISATIVAVLITRVIAAF